MTPRVFAALLAIGRRTWQRSPPLVVSHLPTPLGNLTIYARLLRVDRSIRAFVTAVI